jgi:hypothetical protein
MIEDAIQIVSMEEAPGLLDVALGDDGDNSTGRDACATTRDAGELLELMADVRAGLGLMTAPPKDGAGPLLDAEELVELGARLIAQGALSQLLAKRLAEQAGELERPESAA